MVGSFCCMTALAMDWAGAHLYDTESGCCHVLLCERLVVLTVGSDTIHKYSSVPATTLQHSEWMSDCPLILEMSRR